MTTRTKVRIYYAIVWAVALVWFAWASVALAGGGDDVDVDVRQSNDNNAQTTGDVNVDAGDLVGGDTNVSTGGNKSLALGNVLGDVDIADCLASAQWSTPVFGRQYLKLNNVCMAEFYLRTQQFELAAMALCNVKEILREFDSEQACEDAHDFGPPESPSDEPEEPVTQILEQQQIIETEHEEDIQIVQMAQADIEERLAALERRPAPRVTRAPAPEPEPAFTEEQKAAALEALFGSEDEDDE